MLPSIITKRLIRGICLLGVAVVLSGCSLIQTTYNQLPRLVHFWLDRQVDLSSAQSDRVSVALEKWLVWHRQNELPKVAEELASWQSLVLKPVSGDEVCARFDVIEQWVFEWIHHLNADLTRLGLDLAPTQIAHLRKAYAKSNANWREDWMDGSPEDLLKHRVKRSREWADRLYGKLSTEQGRQLTQLAKDSVFDAPTSFERRKLRQGRVLGTLASWRDQAPSFEQAQLQMKETVNVWRQVPDPVMHAQQERLTRYNCQAIADFHQQTSPAQRAYAVKVLQGYEADVRALMAEKK